MEIIRELKNNQTSNRQDMRLEKNYCQRMLCVAGFFFVALTKKTEFQKFAKCQGRGCGGGSNFLVDFLGFHAILRRKMFLEIFLPKFFKVP